MRARLRALGARTVARARGRPWRADASAGVALGVESVPDGLAAGLLAGVNPVYGLYAYMVGVTAGAAATSSSFMAVQATGAMAVVVSDVPQVHGGTAEADAALFTLAVTTGAIMLGLGLAGLGGAVRFVPHAVLTGFVTAVAVTIVLGQLDSFTGYEAIGGNRITRALDTAVHVGSYSWPTVGVGCLTVVLIWLLARTRLGGLGLVVAIAAASGAARLLGDGAVTVLGDVTEVPAALPTPVLPAPGLVVSLLVPAASLAFVGLVQGAAISGSIPNPDGRYPDPSGDFRGQGVANLAAGLFQGMPVGGSMSATALVRAAGAQSRLALVLAGATMATVILVLADVVAFVAMPALAALLIVVGLRAIRPADVVLVWRTGRVQATVMTTTFVLTLLIPLQYAVLVGVGISVILHVVRQSSTVRVLQWTFDEDGDVTEGDPVRVVGADETIVLRPYGSLFFAAVPVLEAQLPSIGPDSHRSAVIISLRGKEALGSTFLTVLTRYAKALAGAGCVLLVSGVSATLRAQLDEVGATDAIGADFLLPHDVTLLASTRRAADVAQEWRARALDTDERTTEEGS